MQRKQRKIKNNRYLNQLVALNVIGRGDKGDLFGKVDNVVCFINNCDNHVIKFGDVVDVKIVHATDKCIFSEVISDGS